MHHFPPRNLAAARDAERVLRGAARAGGRLPGARPTGGRHLPALHVSCHYLQKRTYGCLPGDACKTAGLTLRVLQAHVFSSAVLPTPENTQHTQSDDALSALEGEAALAGAALPGSDLHTLTASRLVGLLRRRHGSKHARTQAAVAAAVEVRWGACLFQLTSGCTRCFCCECAAVNLPKNVLPS